jgi:iron complex transport system permease protein
MKQQRQLSPGALISLLGAALVVLILTATALGFMAVSPGSVLRIILSRILDLPGLIQGLEDSEILVVTQVRLPRILTSAIVGAGLAMAGVVFQGILLNPLADPYTLGVSAGAAFGASLAFLFGVPFLGLYTVPFMAFVFALATLGAVLWLAAGGERYSSQNLILSGVIVAAILSAGIGLVKHLADEQVSVIIFWLMGSFASKTWWEVGLSLAVIVLGGGVAIFYARDMNILSLGDKTAASLGVETERTRLILLVVTSLMTAVCVSVSGIIGFVGLVVPHLMRFLIGPDNRALLPVSALGGALLLVGADTLTRTALPHEVPIGVLTALIGGPYFCYIFRKRQLGRTNG